MKNMKKIIPILVVLLLLLVSISCVRAYAFSSGSGTPDDPYIITSAAELNAVRHNLSAFFRLGNDIDLTDYLAPGGEGYAKWGASGWLPIGTSDLYFNREGRFSGEFDRNEHKITGLWIDRSDENFVGLFGATWEADIKNLGVEITAARNVNGHTAVGSLVGDVFGGNITSSFAMGNVNGRVYVGGLVGALSPGSITNSFATGNVSGHRDVGGLVGLQAYPSIIKNSYATGNVSGCSDFQSHVGGLVGFQSVGCIKNSYATGNVSGGMDVGGLVGRQNQGSITNSYATGNVSGISILGGLVGYQRGGRITNSYATGNVSEYFAFGSRIGGLVGSQNHISRSDQTLPPDVIKNSFAVGNIIGTYEVGSLVGWQNPESRIINSYRYINLTVNGEKNTENTPDGIYGGVLTAAQLMTKTTYTDIGWLFYPNGPWHWDERGFPKLNIGLEDFPFNFSPD